MPNPGTADTLDIVELVGAVRRGWRQLVGFTLFGAAVAAGLMLFGPRWFNGTTSVVVRSANAGASIMSKLGLPTGSGADGISLGGGLDAGAPQSLETDIQILQSRSLVEQVVDSLGLQAELSSPTGVPTTAVFFAVQQPGSFKRRKYHAQRIDTGPAYRLIGKDTAVLSPGKPARVGMGTLTLRPVAALPPAFDLVIRDHEDAITRAGKKLSVRKAGGEVLRVTYQGADSITAAAAANALIEFYLRLRHTKDRGINEHRVEFITAQLDTVSRKLNAAENSLRKFREASHVLDAEALGKLEVVHAGEIRTAVGLVDVERGALDQLLAQIAAGRVAPRELAVYPSFLKSPAINDLIGRLTTLETQRTLLLQRRRETDDEVVAFDRSIATIDSQLVKLGGSYHSSLERQHADLTAQLDTLNRALGTFPGTIESNSQLLRDVLQLAQTHTGLQASLVSARLAAIGEGGDVRQLDVAAPPKEVAFPRPIWTFGIGVGGGLFLGTIFALFAGLMGRWIEDPQAIERAMGVPALRFDTSVPLLMSGQPVSRTMLLVPLDTRANTAGVADRLARTALARSLQPTVLDLTHTNNHSSNGAGQATALLPDVGATIRRLEGEFSTVIVRLPGLASDEAAAVLNSERPVLLVASPGRVDRRTLFGAIQTLRRLDVPCAGVVVNRSSDVIGS